MTEPARVRPRFLTNYAPTRSRNRIHPFSRVPVTSQLGDVWQVAAERHPTQMVTVDRPPDIDPSRAVTRMCTGWAELVDEAAAWLQEAGVRAWDRVAVLKANHFDVAVLGCAAARIGAIPALLSGGYGADVAHVLLRRLERPFLVADSAHLDSCGLDKEAVADLTERTVCIDAVGERSDVVSLDDLRGGARATPRMRQPDEPMIITHTSGTTGIPKLVMHSGTSAYALALAETERWPVFRYRRDDVFAYADPFWHERIITGMIAWATVNLRLLMLSDPLAPDVRDLLVEHQPTIVETLPNAYLALEHLARDPVRPFRNVRYYINSFDAIHTRTVRAFLDASERHLPLWIQSWSQSEQGPMVFRPYLRWSVRERGRRPPPTQILGWPVPGFGRLRAVDPDTGRPVRRNEVGLIEISQPGRCIAYVGEQERHDRKRNGHWWNTGDLGVINQFGALRLVDREVDRIPGASAIELEDILLDRLPQATEIVVLPVKDGLHTPVISTVDNTPIDSGCWGQAIADLPRLADPIHIRWEEFPRTATFKVSRARLRERLLPGSQAVGIGHWT